MRGNGKVFISHAHDDNERCAPLLAALDAWGVDYWFDTQQMGAGDNLSLTIQRAIADRDIFLRICTPAAQRSYWVQMETGAFRGLQAKQHRAGGAPTLTFINLILDAAYEPEPFDYAHVFIDATSKPQRTWLDELRRALGVATPAVSAMPNASPSSGPEGPVTRIVDASGRGNFTTISAALQAAQAGYTIVVRPGRYAESLVIERQITLRGEGKRETIIIEGSQASALRIAAHGDAITTVEHLTLRQISGKILDCVALAAGRVALVDCDISSQMGGACVNITSDEETLLRKNSIHDGDGWGVFVGGRGIVTLEDNHISGHTYSGLTVMRDGYVQAYRNTITRNSQHAIRVDAGAGGVFEDNDLQGNFLSTWDIDKSSFGQVRRGRNRG